MNINLKILTIFFLVTCIVTFLFAFEQRSAYEEALQQYLIQEAELFYNEEQMKENTRSAEAYMIASLKEQDRIDSLQLVLISCRENSDQ